MKKIIFLFTLVLMLCMNSEVNARTNADQVNETMISRTIDLGEINSPHRFSVFIDSSSEKYVGTAAAIQKISTNDYGWVTFEITSALGAGDFYYEIYTLGSHGEYKGIAVIGKLKN
ncbi:hypothetical protein [Dysgonomonas sp. ZJ709]|uniref:hypothetical protein n=1 Tax=Dysgonomonas sp. ZJ709 TaxID=2709797 RepID=UPI0013ED1B94|nr:hypothetical protein [Dysgonomonas sp. ZJ709]